MQDAPTPGMNVVELDSPQLIIDLDVVDANLRRMMDAFRSGPVSVRVHFKSLKCAGLAQYIVATGFKQFLCAKLNEAEVLADAGITDIFIANQIVGPIKMRRVAALARRVQLRVCVDDAGNVDDLAQAAQESGATIGVLVEVNIGMNRCGVEPGNPALQLARHIASRPGLRFDGLQGYDGHLQLVADAAERRAQSVAALAPLVATRRLIEHAGIPVTVVTGAGTGTWEFVGYHEGVTEIQPGSFILMDNTYHQVRPEFGCALSVLAMIISRQAGRYVLDAGSKAISQDFGLPVVKGRPDERLVRLSEEHARVETDSTKIRIGDRREVIPTHCCATMNLHRQCLAIRNGRVEACWPIEASGKYD